MLQYMLCENATSLSEKGGCKKLCERINGTTCCEEQTVHSAAQRCISFQNNDYYGGYKL